MRGRTGGRTEGTQAGKQRRRRTAGRTRAGTPGDPAERKIEERLQPPARAPCRRRAGALAALARVPSPPSAVAKAQARVGAGSSARLRRPPSSRPRRAFLPRTGQALAEVTSRRVPSRTAPAFSPCPPARGVLGLLRPLTLSSLGAPATSPAPPSPAAPSPLPATPASFSGRSILSSRRCGVALGWLGTKSGSGSTSARSPPAPAPSPVGAAVAARGGGGRRCPARSGRESQRGPWGCLVRGGRGSTPVCDIGGG